MHPKAGVWSRILWLFILTILGGEILSDAFLNLIGLNHNSIFYSTITNLFLIGFLFILNQLITKQTVALNWIHQSKFNWLIFSIVLLAIIILNLIGAASNFELSFSIISMGILSSFLGSIFEEVFFRGILLPSIFKMFHSANVKSIHYAILISSLLFALINVSNGGGQSWLTIIGRFGVNFIFAVLLCVMYIKMRSIWFPVIVHWIWNFMTPYGLNPITGTNNIILIQEGLALLFFLVVIIIILKKKPLKLDLKWVQEIIK